MKIYIHTKCSTCREALDFLKQRGISPLVQDIVKTPPSLEELEQMLAFQEGNIRKLLNTSGQLYRQMELSTKLSKMTNDEVLKMLALHGMLVKRPFLIGTNFGLTGYKKEEWQSQSKLKR